MACSESFKWLEVLSRRVPQTVCLRSHTLASHTLLIGLLRLLLVSSLTHARAGSLTTCFNHQFKRINNNRARSLVSATSFDSFLHGDQSRWALGNWTLAVEDSCMYGGLRIIATDSDRWESECFFGIADCTSIECYGPRRARHFLPKPAMRSPQPSLSLR